RDLSDQETTAREKSIREGGPDAGRMGSRPIRRPGAWPERRRSARSAAGPRAGSSRSVRAAARRLGRVRAGRRDRERSISRKERGVADDEYVIRSIGPGVFIRQGVDNCVWADLGNGTVVIDTLEDPALAAVIQKAAAETVGRPIRWVINTHWDGDHIA